jgi:hypothetical protein
MRDNMERDVKTPPYENAEVDLCVQSVDKVQGICSGFCFICKRYQEIYPF